MSDIKRCSKFYINDNIYIVLDKTLRDLINEQLKPNIETAKEICK